MVDRRTGAWYPSYYGQTPETDPDFQQVYGNRGQGNPQGGQQSMTPPIIHADIIQIDDPAEMDRHPMAAGTNQMFATRDDGHIIIRSMLANGEHADTYYDKRPPAPPAPKINPEDYVRKDEIATLIAETIQSMKGAK